MVPSLEGACTFCAIRLQPSDPWLKEPLQRIEIIMKVCLDVSADADFICRSRSSAPCERVVLVSSSLSRLSDSFTTQDFNMSLCSCSMKVNRKMSPSIWATVNPPFWWISKVSKLVFKSWSALWKRLAGHLTVWYPSQVWRFGCSNKDRGHQPGSDVWLHGPGLIKALAPNSYWIKVFNKQKGEQNYRTNSSKSVLWLLGPLD